MTTYAGVVATITDLVGVASTNPIVTISQNVELQSSYSGIIATIQNSTETITSGRAVTISNRIRNFAIPPHFITDTQTPWDFIIYIGAIEITHSMIHGDIIIDKGENNSSTAEFTVLVDDPVTFVDNVYDGSKQVTIDYESDGIIYRLITALVDAPQIDMINKNVKIRCSNQRDELITQKMPSVLQTFGRYSEPVMGKVTSVKDEADKRSQTVPTSIDFDSYNTLNLNSWFAKASADFILDGGDIYRRTPTVDWQNRHDVVNRVVIDLQYKHTRLYHQQKGWSWTAPYNGNPSDYETHQYSSPTLDMIKTAISGTSWTLVSPISSTTTYILVAPWFGGVYAVTPEIVKDISGNAVLDAKGDAYYSSGGGEYTTTTQPNVMQASWTAAKRYSQFLNDHYTLTVQAPQSITKNGTVTSSQSVSYSDDYDASDWEAFTKPVNTSSYYTDVAELSPGALNKAIQTSLDMARVAILDTHRGTLITVESRLIPNLELKHTVELSLPLIACKGRVVKIRHTLDTFDGDTTTQITLALFRVPGSASDTPRVAPTRPTYTPSIDSSGVTLGNHYGIPAIDGTYTDAWNGFIGNMTTSYRIDLPGSDFRSVGVYTVKTSFTDIFRVDTPAIPDSLRAIKDLPASGSYNVAIPNDPLTIDLAVI